MIASGVSQSQGRPVVTYYNSRQPLAQFDAFYVFLGLGGRLRTDMETKVFRAGG